MAGLRVFSGGAVIVLGGGGSGGNPLPPPVTPTNVYDQSAVERALGLPQVLQIVVSYQGTLKLTMGVPANELDQEPFP